MSELPLMSIPELGVVLRAMAKSARVSVTALAISSGHGNGTLIGLATGSSTQEDCNALPVFRMMDKAGWEMVAKPKGGEWVTVSREGALPLRVIAADGGPLEITVGGLEDLPRLLNTLALANDSTISGLTSGAKIAGSALVGLATGRANTNKGVRLRGIWRVVDHAGFVLYARPRHRTRRAARLAAEVGQLLTRS